MNLIRNKTVSIIIIFLSNIGFYKDKEKCSIEAKIEQSISDINVILMLYEFLAISISVH